MCCVSAIASDDRHPDWVKLALPSLKMEHPTPSQDWTHARTIGRSVKDIRPQFRVLYETNARRDGEFCCGPNSLSVQSPHHGDEV